MKRIDADEAWERMVERNRNRWKQPAEAAREDIAEETRRRAFPSIVEDGESVRGVGGGYQLERHDATDAAEDAEVHRLIALRPRIDADTAYDAMVQRNRDAWKERGK